MDPNHVIQQFDEVALRFVLHPQLRKVFPKRDGLSLRLHQFAHLANQRDGFFIGSVAGLFHNIRDHLAVERNRIGCTCGFEFFCQRNQQTLPASALMNGVPRRIEIVFP